MRQRQAVAGLAVASFITLCLLVAFGLELSNQQSAARRNVETRIHERAVLAAGLIDSLLGTVESNSTLDTKLYGAAHVSTRTMDAEQGAKDYLVLLGPHGAVLAHSWGFTRQARAELPSSVALALTRAGRRYGLGNIRPYGSSGVIDLASTFPTAYGTRTLVSGVPLQAFALVIGSDLRKIPGVKGSHSSMIDGHDAIIASTNPDRPSGYLLGRSAQAAIARGSGDRKGRYYDVVPLTNSGWRIVLSAPNGPFFATVEGLHKWLPWVILVALAAVAVIALLLRVRLVHIADKLRKTNGSLELVNRELAQANEALERRAAELTRSNDELEQFASIASHDLQEPLRKVRTFTQRVIDDEADALSERGADYLRRAGAAAERMQHLIEDLLRFSRLATHGRPFAPVDLDGLVRDVLDDLTTQVSEAGAAVHIGKLPTIWGDAVQLRQLMQNLLSNALKFQRPDVPLQIDIAAKLRGNQVEITVADNGIGFDPQYSRRIFRVFERLHGRGTYPGTGIGLSLCGKIVDRHGGTIRADGAPGEGATFTILLPTDRRHETVSISPTAWRREDTDTDTNTEHSYASV